ncbi:MAG: YbaB/EbfC family nucleoid-associated protein [Campylobacterales bacterium]|nr:YbaB/EbfC family nucleoid-associated protein [Campylobacterales bacterium]
MFGNMDLSQLGEMMGDIQKKAEEVQQGQKDKVYEAKAGGGLVSVKANGSGEIIDLNIDDSLLEDKESLQILLLSAINDVSKSVDADRKNMAMSAIGDLGNLMKQ